MISSFLPPVVKSFIPSLKSICMLISANTTPSNNGSSANSGTACMARIPMATLKASFELGLRAGKDKLLWGKVAD